MYILFTCYSTRKFILRHYSLKETNYFLNDNNLSENIGKQKLNNTLHYTYSSLDN